MTRSVRTLANCLEDADREARFKWGQAVPLPVDCTDAIRFPNIALACADLAAMPAAKRDRLNAEWETRNV